MFLIHCNGVVLCLTLQAVIFIKLRADFASDKAATGLEVIVPMPKEVQRVSCEYEQDVQPIGNQTWDWQEKQHRLVWKHKKVKGSTEWTLRVGPHARICFITQQVCCWAFAVHSLILSAESVCSVCWGKQECYIGFTTLTSCQPSLLVTHETHSAFELTEALLVPANMYGRLYSVGQIRHMYCFVVM